MIDLKDLKWKLVNHFIKQRYDSDTVGQVCFRLGLCTTLQQVHDMCIHHCLTEEFLRLTTSDTVTKEVNTSRLREYVNHRLTALEECMLGESSEMKEARFDEINRLKNQVALFEREQQESFYHRMDRPKAQKYDALIKYIKQRKDWLSSCKTSTVEAANRKENRIDELNGILNVNDSILNIADEQDKC